MYIGVCVCVSVCVCVFLFGVHASVNFRLMPICLGILC